MCTMSTRGEVHVTLRKQAQKEQDEKSELEQ